jgi:NAD-dependent SIR2 family protein deacetylase
VSDLAQPVTILTGAGVSAESGIPTFRGTGPAGFHYIEINPNETPLSPYADEILRRPAGMILPD